MGNDSAKQVGTEVDDGAHQQPSRGPAFNGHARRIAVARGGQVLDGCNEVSEGVALDQHFSGVVPGLAQVAAAANVRIGHDEAAIEQAETV